jgi:predicted RNA methylase
MSKFEEQYFKNLNYSNYLERYGRYSKMAEELDFYLTKFGFLSKSMKILDYGCSVGFLIKALKKLGYKKIFGFDISNWAIKIAKKNKCKILKDFKGSYDLGIFLDVLEHMNDKEIKKVFKKAKFKRLLVRIPCADKNSNKFYLKVSRIDKTHINCKNKESWISLFKSFGYKSFLKLNLNSIYDSKGCLCLLII